MSHMSTRGVYPVHSPLHPINRTGSAVQGVSSSSGSVLLSGVAPSPTQRSQSSADHTSQFCAPERESVGQPRAFSRPPAPPKPQSLHVVQQSASALVSAVADLVTPRVKNHRWWFSASVNCIQSYEASSSVCANGEKIGATEKRPRNPVFQLTKSGGGRGGLGTRRSREGSEPPSSPSPSKRVARDPYQRGLVTLSHWLVGAWTRQ